MLGLSRPQGDGNGGGDPSAVQSGASMPPYGELPDEELQALAGYLAALK